MTTASSPRSASDTPLSLALKAEFERMLQEPLTTAQALRIARYAASTVKVLRSVATGIDGVLPKPKRPSFMAGTPEEDVWIDGAAEEIWSPLTNPMPLQAPGGLAENMGNSVVREALALLPQFLEKRRVNDLITSMALAKNAGLTDVVASLRAELDTLLKKTHGLPDDGPRQLDLPFGHNGANPPEPGELPRPDTALEQLPSPLTEGHIAEIQFAIKLLQDKKEDAVSRNDFDAAADFRDRIDQLQKKLETVAPSHSATTSVAVGFACSDQCVGPA